MLPDGKPAYLTVIPKTETVGGLMKEIMKEIALTHNTFSTWNLTLYKIDLDGSDTNYIEEVKKLVRKLDDLHLLNQLDLLDMVFPEPPNPQGRRIQILVVPTPGEPTNSKVCG